MAEVAQLVFQERAMKGNLLIPVPPLPLEHDGVYDFVVLADGQEIDRQQFIVHEKGGSANAPSHPEDPKGD